MPRTSKFVHATKPHEVKLLLYHYHFVDVCAELQSLQKGMLGQKIVILKYLNLNSILEFMSLFSRQVHGLSVFCAIKPLRGFSDEKFGWGGVGHNCAPLHLVVQGLKECGIFF